METSILEGPIARKSRMPARLDIIQGASGLFLVLFMWLHMFFVSSILLGREVFDAVARFFEGYYLLGQSYPIIVSMVVAFVFTVFILHAALAMRKMPADYRQYRQFHTHMRGMRHGDTTLWYIQVVTGFAMFFLGSVHLFIMLTRPETIGSIGSSLRVVEERMWLLYLVLLLAVELHGSIGLYRLIVKWGWLASPDPDRTRRRLKQAKWVITVFFVLLGLASLAAYIKIGLELRTPDAVVAISSEGPIAPGHAWSRTSGGAL